MVIALLHAMVRSEVLFWYLGLCFLYLADYKSSENYTHACCSFITYQRDFFFFLNTQKSRKVDKLLSDNRTFSLWVWVFQVNLEISISPTYFILAESPATYISLDIKTQAHSLQLLHLSTSRLLGHQSCALNILPLSSCSILPPGNFFYFFLRLAVLLLLWLLHFMYHFYINGWELICGNSVHYVTRNILSFLNLNTQI